MDQILGRITNLINATLQPREKNIWKVTKFNHRNVTNERTEYGSNIRKDNKFNQRNVTTERKEYLEGYQI
jgi:hypothetical protein